MLKKAISILVIFTLFSIGNISAQKHHEGHKEKDHKEQNAHGHNSHEDVNLSLKEKIKKDIQHHLLDSHSFHLTNDIGFPLPVILWDEGLHFFSSNTIEHGIAKSGDKHFVISHDNGLVYKTDANGTIHKDEKGLIINKKPFDLSITKNVVFILLVAFLMLWLFTNLAKSYKKNNGVASGLGRFFEPIILYIRDDIAKPNIGEKSYRKFMPFLLTIFFFIWFLNLLGLTPLGAGVTSNIAVTAGLALLTFLITTFSAKKDYWQHIFWMPGVPFLMKIVLAPIELLGTIIKPFALMIRLYANMMAGHVVLMTIIGLIFIFQNWIGSPLSFGLAFGISILELLVAALQAYIFTMLAALYFGSAVEEHDHDHEGAHSH